MKRNNSPRHLSNRKLENIILDKPRVVRSISTMLARSIYDDVKSNCVRRLDTILLDHLKDIKKINRLISCLFLGVLSITDDIDLDYESLMNYKKTDVEEFVKICFILNRIELIKDPHFFDTDYTTTMSNIVDNIHRALFYDRRFVNYGAIVSKK